jgi:glucosamine-6-phosphate deaminase
VSLDLVVVSSAAEVCRRAADVVAETLAAKPDAVLALPAGNTPRPLYAELVRRHRGGEVSFAHAAAFTLDEYAGLPADHPMSFRRLVDEALLRHVDLPAARAHAPDGLAVDRAAECARYERAIAEAGGFDLALLGIGGNGHIAFNEPPAPFSSRTRVVTLAAATRAAVATQFSAALVVTPVPAEALTIGISTILDARRCVLIAYGAGKAEAVARMLCGPATPEVPASALQLHPNATVIVDQAAASRLTPPPG